MTKYAASLIGNFQDNFYHSGLPDAIYDTLEAVYTNLALPAGTTTATVATVPANEIWRVESAKIMRVGTSGTALNILITRGGVNYYVTGQSAPVASQIYGFEGLITLESGDIIKAEILGATLNDDLYCWILGHKMRVKA